MTVRNGSAGWLCLWLEPLGEDRWLRSGETFRITSDYAGDKADFQVDYWVDDQDRAAGIENVTVWIQYGNPYAEVTDDDGHVVECGHQRPPEVALKWEARPEGTAFESVSTWRQPEPAPTSEARTAAIAEVADRIDDFSPLRLRVAIDGFTAAGKTSFGHELAAALRRRGRSTLRASFDDFKNPWREARERGYDRVTGEGYYRNAYDFDSARNLLLKPAGRDGGGIVVLCAHDPLTGVDHRAVTVKAPPDAILIVDSVFGFRPEFNEFWDFRIWIDVDPKVSLARGIERDTASEGGVAEATALHRDRYHAAMEIYLSEVDPKSIADVIIDNSDFTRPRLTWRSRDQQ
jgi:uridine kinase